MKNRFPTYVAFSPDQIPNRIVALKGDRIECPVCGRPHSLSQAGNMLYYQCNNRKRKVTEETKDDFKAKLEQLLYEDSLLSE
jgi:hypothetical protein